MERAIGLIALFGRSQSPRTMSELARASSLAVSTVSRLLDTLARTGFVERTERGRFVPGVQLARIGLVALQRFEAFRLSEQHLRRLVRESGETASLAVRVDADHAVYLRQLPGPRALRHASWAGRLLPLRSTATGAALLGRLGKYRYVARRNSVETGFTALAAPVRDGLGNIVAALSIAGPSVRMPDDALPRLGRLVADQAHAASQEIASARQGSAP